jgi:hypothetical protein
MMYGGPSPPPENGTPKKRHTAKKSQSAPEMTTTDPSSSSSAMSSHFFPPRTVIVNNNHQHYNNNNNNELLTQHPQVLPTATATATADDADIAAGQITAGEGPAVISSFHSTASTNTLSTLESAPTSVCTINTKSGHPTELEFFEDLITEPVLVLGIDISHLSRNTQFTVCATALFFFSLLYGYLQELLSVELCSRKLGLFLAMMQFIGYTIFAYILRNFVYNKQQKKKSASSSSLLLFTTTHVPVHLYLGLALLRAVDLAMTNLAMQYINYPAKTIMKSSRVVFTMIFGVFIQRKAYKTVDCK